MGRDTVTVDSKILIRGCKFPAVIEALQHYNDEDLGLEGSVCQCLGDYSIVLADTDKNGNYEFIVDDGDTDEDYDIEVLLKLAKCLEDGSFYEQSSDEGLSVFEIQGGTVTETVYDYGDGERRGELIRQSVLSQEQHEAAGKATREIMGRIEQLFGSPRPEVSDDRPDPWDAVRAWWKLDDPEWVKHRKSEWKTISANLRRMEYPAKEIKALRHCFLTGEDPEDKSYFSRTDRFLCAPYNSPEKAKLLFDLFGNSTDEQEKLLKSHQYYVACLYDGLPNAQAKVRDFQQGVLGDVYQPLTGIKRDKEVSITESPDRLIDSWCNRAKRWLSGETRDYTAAYGFVIDQVPYIFSTLEYLDHNGEPIPESLAKLSAYVNLINDVLSLTEYQQEFCDLFLVEVARDNLPKSIAESLIGCSESPFAAEEPLQVEEQLEKLVASNIRLNDGVELEDLFRHLSREAMESKPYGGLLIALGLNRTDDESVPLSDSLWACNDEDAYAPGSHAGMLMRFEGMTDGALDITDAEDFRDKRKEECWLRFKSAGNPIEMSLSPYQDAIEFDDVAFKYDEMLMETGSGYRIYADDMRFGNLMLVGAFTEDQIGKLRMLSKIRMFNFDEFAAKYK